ncbi:MAG: MSCRAMM family protein [Planctomycetota bacterium]
MKANARRSLVVACALSATLIYLFARHRAGGGPESPPDLPGAARSATAPDIRPERTEPRSPPPEPREEFKAPKGAILARVADAGTGSPLGGERLSVLLSGRRARAEEVATDPEGLFRLAELEPGDYSLVTRHADYLADSRAVRVEAGAVSEVAIRLVLGEVLAGQVVDARDRPVEGALVRLVLEGGTGLERASASSAAEGTFLVRGLRPGRWAVSVARAGYRLARRSADVPAPGPLRIKISEDPGFEVIVATSEGAPVEGARVSAFRRTGGVPGARGSGVTAADGRIRLPGLPEDPAEEVQILVAHPRQGTVRAVATGEALAAGPFRVALGTGATLAGRVVDPSGAGVPGAEVLLERPDGTALASLRALSGGEFEFERVPPGTYRIAALSRDRGAGFLDGLAVPPGSAERALEIRLVPGGGALAGRVLDSAGRPQALASISIEISTPGRRLVFETVSAEDGTFRFEALPAEPGTACRLRARPAGSRRALETEVRLGDLDVPVRLDRPGSIRGTVPGEGPPASATFVLTPVDGGAPRAGGELRFQASSAGSGFLLRDVPPGTYALAVFVGSELRWQASAVAVRPGEETGSVELSPVAAPP